MNPRISVIAAAHNEGEALPAVLCRVGEPDPVRLGQEAKAAIEAKVAELL